MLNLSIPPIYDGEVQKIIEVTIWRDAEDDAHHDVDKVVHDCYLCSEDP